MKKSDQGGEAHKLHNVLPTDDKFASAQRLRDLGWNVEACTDSDCPRCALAANMAEHEKLVKRVEEKAKWRA